MAINVRHYRGLSMALLQLKEPLKLFVEIRDFLLSSRVLSRRDMTEAAESDVKPNPSFLPSLHKQKYNLGHN